MSGSLQQLSAALRGELLALKKEWILGSSQGVWHSKVFEGPWRDLVLERSADKKKKEKKEGWHRRSSTLDALERSADFIG